MAAVSPDVRAAPARVGLIWIPVVLGLLAMYVPTALEVYQKFWIQEDEAHGPLILLIVVWLIWRERHAIVDARNQPRPRAGWLCLGLGLLLYVIGRSQQFFQFDVGSLIPVLLGLALIFAGTPGLKRILFPAFFILFLVPVPPSVLDQILVPLKATVSEVVTNGLYALGYPIARSGVILQIGQYHLLIADACSGLKSMVALSGIGLLYVYLAGHKSRLTNGILLACAIPLAFLANVLRVSLLALVTYYCGDDWGQWFHDYAGYLEIAVAFGGFFLLDDLLVRTGRVLGNWHLAGQP